MSDPVSSGALSDRLAFRAPASPAQEPPSEDSGPA